MSANGKGSARKGRPFRRSGLHRLECQCGAYIYGTVASLERHGLPQCSCGSTFLPDRVELAELLGVDDCPAVEEYRRELASVQHGQASHGIRGRALKPAEMVAAERVERWRRERARTNRLTALLPAAEAMPF